MDRNDTSRTKDIVDVIISGIHKGTFAPGKRLPSQREMADLFGVSRTVIREAVKILEGRQIVSSKQGSGIYVCDIPDSLDTLQGEPNSQMLALSLRDLLEVAWVLWHESAKLMTRNASSEEITALTDMTHSMHRRFPKSTVQERYIYETTFGRILSKYSDNPLMQKLMDDLFGATSDIDYIVVENPNEYKKIIEIDLKTAEALQERDVERAWYLQFERDRIIKSILAQNSDILDKTYCINISINPNKLTS